LRWRRSGRHNVYRPRLCGRSPRLRWRVHVRHPRVYRRRMRSRPHGPWSDGMPGPVHIVQRRHLLYRLRGRPDMCGRPAVLPSELQLCRHVLRHPGLRHRHHRLPRYLCVQCGLHWGIGVCHRGGRVRDRTVHPPLQQRRRLVLAGRSGVRGASLHRHLRWPQHARCDVRGLVRLHVVLRARPGDTPILVSPDLRASQASASTSPCS
jgi:hypothetical protein